MKNIAILGSSGSIGTQALEVIRQNSGVFNVSVLSVHQNADLLIQQAKEFLPARVVVTDPDRYNDIKQGLSGLDIDVLSGEESLCEVVVQDDVDIVLTAVVGFCGLRPTLAAIEAGKIIALANKETLVVAGQLVMQRARQKGVAILPVDSEHSAIFQCLAGEEGNNIEKIALTASGGPFRGKDGAFLQGVTVKQALKHPNWSMGAKITIDSASLMNKGLEVIEARWLFNLRADQIDVIVHPQSVIHSMVQFEDGSMKAQMGVPDMKLPIQYALAYPGRLRNDFLRFDFLRYPELTFEQPDVTTFKNLALAYKALQMEGTMPCILNAANEVVVSEFLNERIGFMEMSDVIERCMNEVSYIRQPALQDFLETDEETRRLAKNIVTEFKKVYPI